MTTLERATLVACAMHDSKCVRKHPPEPPVPRPDGWSFTWSCGITKAVTSDPEGLRVVARYWQVAAGDTL